MATIIIMACHAALGRVA